MSALSPSLNPTQAEAVTHRDGPLLILAGAGSGKTHVLTQRIAALLREGAAAPWQILAVTFTNKAASELKTRLQTLIGPEATGIWASTFHGLGLRILRRHIDRLGYDRHFTILDDAEQLSVVTEIVKGLELDPERYPPKSLLAQISKAKSQGLTPDQLRTTGGPNGRQQSIVADVYERQLARLKALNALDFDDLLLLPLRLFKAHPDVLAEYQQRFKYLHVDEYQDTNPTQYDLIRLLAGETGQLCVVGDVDQSIYSFRHADFTIILRFRDDFPGAKVITLEENYRSTETILDVANAIISYNEQRYPKTLRATKGKGEPLPVFAATSETEEAQYVIHQIQELGQRRQVAPGDVAVLYRTNAQSRPLEEAFVKAGMAYQLIGGTRFYERREIKDLIAYLRLIYNPADDLSFKRIVNVPKRKLGATTIAKLETAAQAAGKSLNDVIAGAPVPGISPATWSKLAQFASQLARWRLFSESEPVADLLQQVLLDTGYVDYLFSDSPDDANDRHANIEELHRAASEFAETAEDASLGAYLLQVALVADVDGLEAGDAVTLMTLHSAKGLEFPVVFLVGLEDGIFPHARSLDDPVQMEEERRLMYVGVTRAMERLYLTWAMHRTQWGRTNRCVPSRFLKEAPIHLLQGFTMPKEEPQKPARGLFADERGSAKEEWTQDLDTWTARSSLSARKHVPTFDVGDQVRHGTWGIGTVAQVIGQGDRACVVVEFPALGKKILDPRFAALKKVD